MIHVSVGVISPALAANAPTTAMLGSELRGPAYTYSLVKGDWYVPQVSGETNNHDYSAFWIGLDGDDFSDLWQAGTEQDITEITILGIQFDFATYYAWTEFLPRQTSEQCIPSIDGGGENL